MSQWSQRGQDASPKRPLHKPLSSEKTLLGQMHTSKFGQMQLPRLKILLHPFSKDLTTAIALVFRMLCLESVGYWA